MSTPRTSSQMRDHFLSECRYALTDEFLLESLPVIEDWPCSITRALVLLEDLESFQKVCRAVHVFGGIVVTHFWFVTYAIDSIIDSIKRSKDFSFASVLYNEFPKERRVILRRVFESRCGRHYAFDSMQRFDEHRNLVLSPTVRDVVKGFLFFENRF